MNHQDWWSDTEYARETYLGPPPTDELIAELEAELGVRLPRAYVAMMRMHNGGIPQLKNHPTSTRTTWAEDHVAVHGIFGIGREPEHSLCGDMGSEFWKAEWGYPDLGVYFADCPSAGHDMIAMDYRDCGPEGEPRIVHVDEERAYAVTVLADNFADFAAGLRGAEAFEAE